MPVDIFFSLTFGLYSDFQSSLISSSQDVLYACSDLSHSNTMLLLIVPCQILEGLRCRTLTVLLTQHQPQVECICLAVKWLFYSITSLSKAESSASTLPHLEKNTSFPRVTDICFALKQEPGTFIPLSLKQTTFASLTSQGKGVLPRFLYLSTHGNKGCREAVEVRGLADSLQQINSVRERDSAKR